jgi:uncharacterized RDD family membrane protein YckC
MHAPNPYAPPAAPARPLRLEIEHDAPLASRSSRFVALLLDWLVSGLVMIPGAIVGAVLGGEDLADVLAVGSLALFWGLQWLMVASSGQTVGKRWCGIRIVGQRGARVGFVRGVLLRSWVMQGLTWIPVLGGLLGLVDVLMIFGSQRRCLHDRLAGTKVVMAR